MTINEYFDRIFLINLGSRPERWQHAQDEAVRLGLTKMERFEAYVMSHDIWPVHGNAGCTASHRALLEIISYLKIPRALILEDDFCARTLERDINDLFSDMIGEVPDNWEMLYLGGGYQEAPQYRVSKHVIRSGGIMTTSSYGITCGAARKIAPYISGPGPIDSLYFGWNRTLNCYIFQPRLMIQYATPSDLTNRESDNRASMEDSLHEAMV